MSGIESMEINDSSQERPFSEFLRPHSQIEGNFFQIGDNTDKVVRFIGGAELEQKFNSENLSEIEEELKRAWAEVRNIYGISVSADMIVTKNDKGTAGMYVITDKIDGQGPKDVELISPEDSESFANELDNLLSSLAKYFLEKLKNKERFCADIARMDQYVYGTGPQQTEKKMHLVDVDAGYIDNSYFRFARYLKNLIEFGRVMEQKLGRKLDSTRTQFNLIEEFLSDKTTAKKDSTREDDKNYTDYLYETRREELKKFLGSD